MSASELAQGCNAGVRAALELASTSAAASVRKPSHASGTLSRRCRPIAQCLTVRLLFFGLTIHLISRPSDRAKDRQRRSRSPTTSWEVGRAGRAPRATGRAQDEACEAAIPRL
jgi:hypothetical protein